MFILYLVLGLIVLRELAEFAEIQRGVIDLERNNGYREYVPFRASAYLGLGVLVASLALFIGAIVATAAVVGVAVHCIASFWNWDQVDAK